NQTLSASPSGSVVVGLKLTDPDLVISGINSAPNTGVLSVHSGTIAAAVTALDLGVPAIAVSNSILSTDYQGAAQFTADVVARLVKNAHGGKLLPDGIGLTINYPKTDPKKGTPKGVIFTRIGLASPVNISAKKVKPGVLTTSLVLDFTAKGIPKDQIEQEGIALREGYVSVSVLKDGYGAS